MELTDARLEKQIRDAQDAFDTAVVSKNTDLAKSTLKRLTDLVSQRSEAQVSKLEEERGLL